MKNVGIEKEEEEGVMSKVRKTERREFSNFGSVAQGNVFHLQLGVFELAYFFFGQPLLNAV